MGTPGQSKIIRVLHTGGTGNRVFQYFFGRMLQKHVKGAVLIGYDIPLFKLTSPPPRPIPERHAFIEGKHEFNVGRIVYTLNSDVLDAVTCQTYSQRMEYLPDIEEARFLLKSGLDPSLGAAVPPDALLIHIRWPQPSDGGHGDYMPLPISYYKKLVDATGLRPIFMGQIEEGLYFDRLKRVLPNAEFLASAEPLSDFNTIVSARHIAISISSFSWLAAWLSTQAVSIHVPLCGLLNPLQRSDIDLLPYPDRRYRYYKFPITHWRNNAEQVESLFTSDEGAPEISAQEIAQLKAINFRPLI